MARGYRRLSAKAIAPAQLGLVRERLTSRAAGRLGLVLAPAGYGKTRLLAQVTDAFAGAVCWYRADCTDRDPALLLSKLGDALLRSLELPPGVAASAAGTASREPAPWEPAPWEPVLDAVAAAGRPLLLVVDDFHELADSESDAGRRQPA